MAYSATQRSQTVVPCAPSQQVDDLIFTPASFDFSASQIMKSQSQRPPTSFGIFASQIKKSQRLQPPKRSSTPSAKSNVGSDLIGGGVIRGTKSKDFMSQQAPDNRQFQSMTPMLYNSVEHTTASTDIFSPAPLRIPGSNIQLRSIDEIPSRFRNVFTFPFFNVLQSMVMDQVLYSDKSVVVSAPTGSGKTVAFELAIVRLLLKTDGAGQQDKIVYMSPMKSLCGERFQDWSTKFTCHGLNCLELTGDTELDDLSELFASNLICTTPEKWDSMSRRWKDNKMLFQQIKLFLIDEVHILNDPNRGATVEAVVSRMKTLQTSCHSATSNHIRFVAVSATMPNYNDITDWLSTPSRPAVSFNLEEKYRPVKLERVVMGYPFKEGTSEFRFDMNLSYRLRAIIDNYCHGKPTLVFCSSRKSVVQTAEILAKDVRSRSLLNLFSSEGLQRAAASIHEHKLAEVLSSGIGMHHAGLDTQDRHTVEELFKSSRLPVLISTSTLAMGVNLPAHLVIIKSTFFYNMGVVQEYSDMQLLQMIGRAGRPQFDTSATAVIMTKMSLKSKYASLINGTQLIESSLHKNLIEHLNAEVVLQTITNISLAVEWMRHTFLYVRVMKNAKHYGLPAALDKADIETRLQELCLRNLNLLTELSLVHVQADTSEIMSLETGKLMARYCIAFETMRHFHGVQENQEGVADLLEVISGCAEFCEIQLRTNEKKILNSLNHDKNKETIRFPLTGKIKTKQMKVNCLIQAQLSCLTVQDFSLSQDMTKIFRVGQRVTKCFMELMYQGKNYSLLLHSLLIYKAFKTKLWFDSRYVSRQLDGIGQTMSLALANSGLSSFQKLEQASPRDIEVIVNRHPPFGNHVKAAVEMLPKYELAVEQVQPYKEKKAVLKVCVELVNAEVLQEKPSGQTSHQAILLVGDEANNIVYKCRILDTVLLRNGSLSRTFDVCRVSQGVKLNISLLSLDWVGLDIQTSYEPVYAAGWFGSLSMDNKVSNTLTPAAKLSALVQGSKACATQKATGGSCQHRCVDKLSCGHKCCKPKRRAAVDMAEGQGNKQARVESYFPQQTKDVREAYALMRKHGSFQGSGRISLQKFAFKKSETPKIAGVGSSEPPAPDSCELDDDCSDHTVDCGECDNDSASDVICMDDLWSGEPPESSLSHDSHNPSCKDSEKFANRRTPRSHVPAKGPSETTTTTSVSIPGKNHNAQGKSNSNVSVDTTRGFHHKGMLEMAHFSNGRPKNKFRSSDEICDFQNNRNIAKVIKNGDLGPEDEAVWDLGESIEWTSPTSPAGRHGCLEEDRDGDKGKGQRLRKGGSGDPDGQTTSDVLNRKVHQPSGLQCDQIQGSGWNELDSFVQRRQSLFASGDHPYDLHSDPSSDLEELPDLVDSPSPAHLGARDEIHKSTHGAMTHSDEELMSLMESPTVSAIMKEVAPSMSGHHTTHRENTSIFSSVSAQVDGAASWRQRTPGGAVAADSCDTRDRACNYGFSRCQTSSPQCLTIPSKPSSSCWAHPGGNLAEIDDDCRPDTAEFRMNEMVAFPTMSAVNLNSLSGKVDPDDAKTHSSDSASCCMSTSGKSRRSAIAQSVQRAPVISHTSDDCRNWTEFSPHSNVIVATKPVEDNSNFHETAPHSTHCLLPMSPKPWTDGPNWKETIAPSGPKPWKDGPNWKETIGPSVPKPPTDWSHWGTSKAGSVSSTPLTYSSCWSKPITAQTKNIMPTSLKSVDEDWTDKNEETVVQIQNTAVTPKSVHHQDNAFNQDESAPNVEEESISWSPKDAILSSPSTDDGFSQSSHRYGKVLAWAKSSQGANGHLSSSLHKSSCSSQQACLSLSSGEVAGGPSSLLQVLEEQQPQACLSVSPDETPGTSSLPQTPSKTNVMTTTQEQTADCSSSFVPPAANTTTLLLSGSTQRRDLRTFPDTHTTTTTTSPGLFPPTEVPALSRRCLWRQEGQEEERELCVSTSTPALKSASTSRNFLSQLFAAGDSSRNSSHQLMGNVFDGLF